MTAPKSNNSEQVDCLPLGWRVLFATVLPLLVAYVGSRLWIYAVWSSASDSSLVKGRGYLGLFLVGSVSIVPLFVIAPFVLFLACMAATVKWKTWWTAFLGGMLRIGVGIACGALLLYALFALT